MANPTDPKSAEEKESQNDKGNTASSTSSSDVVKSDNTHDEENPKCIDDYKSRQLPDHTVRNIDIEAVEEEHESQNGVAEQEGIHSWPSLASSNLTVDARACRMPRRIPKGALTAQEKLGLSDHDLKKDTEFDKELEKKTKKLKEPSEIETFIKNLVRNNQFSEIKFFDAAIVYDKNDYESVADFKQELIFIAKSNLREDLRIELFDSEEFAQSKIMVVEDVMKRCSVVLVYLTRNFTSPELNLFIEEGIGISRLGMGPPLHSSQEQWVLKPVHTMSRKSRNYKAPVGLITVNGIDWFDRYSSHTMNQIITMLQAAIVQRKQRETEGNTSQNYKEVFGSVPEMPVLGPPFNKINSHKRPNLSIPQLPVQQQTAQLISQGSPVFPSFRNDPTAIRTDTQPSVTPDVRKMQYGDASQLHVPRNTSLAGRFVPQGGSFDMNAHLRLERGNQPNVCPPYEMPPPYSPYIYQQFGQPPVGGQQFSQPFLYNVPTHQPEYIYQSAGLANANQLLGQIPNYQTSAMHAEPPVQLDMRQSRMPVYPSNMNAQGTDRYDSYTSQHMSRDALHSEPGNFRLDQRNDTPTSPPLSVVSQVSGNLITKTNLSTDDDVEIDTHSRTDHVRQTRKIPAKVFNVSHDSEDSKDESDYSSDSDSDMDFPVNGKVVHKVVNIVGCKNVQFGEGNRVKEVDTKQETSDKLSKKRTEQSNRAIKEPSTTAANIISNENLRTSTSNYQMNISMSEDNMSVENVLSGDSHYNVEDTLSGDSPDKLSNRSEKTNLLSSDAARLEPEKGTKTKKNAKLKVHIDERKNANEDRTMDSDEIFSPEDNISEDQLFGSGSLSLDTNSSFPSYNIRSPSEAPFSFTQGIQQARDLRQILYSSLNINNFSDGTFNSKTCVNYDVD